MEFDVEKIEAIDYDYISEQVSNIFKSQNDVNSFVAFLRNIKNFVALSNDKRHTTLLELSYFKSQIQLFEKRISSLMNEMKTKQTKDAVKKLKFTGEKLSENSILAATEDVEGLKGLEDLHSIVYCWYTYLQDLYFVCGQTNKNLGSF